MGGLWSPSPLPTRFNRMAGKGRGNLGDKGERMNQEHTPGPWHVILPPLIVPGAISGEVTAWPIPIENQEAFAHTPNVFAWFKPDAIDDSMAAAQG